MKMIIYESSLKKTMFVLSIMDFSYPLLGNFSGLRLANATRT